MVLTFYLDLDFVNDDVYLLKAASFLFAGESSLKGTRCDVVLDCLVLTISLICRILLLADRLANRSFSEFKDRTDLL